MWWLLLWKTMIATIYHDDIILSTREARIVTTTEQATMSCWSNNGMNACVWWMLQKVESPKIFSWHRNSPKNERDVSRSDHQDWREWWDGLTTIPLRCFGYSRTTTTKPPSNTKITPSTHHTVRRDKRTSLIPLVTAKKGQVDLVLLSLFFLHHTNVHHAERWHAPPQQDGLDAVHDSRSVHDSSNGKFHGSSPHHASLST